jgi:hypothetical protein
MACERTADSLAGLLSIVRCALVTDLRDLPADFLRRFSIG